MGVLREHLDGSVLLPQVQQDVDSDGPLKQSLGLSQTAEEMTLSQIN